MNSIKDLRNLLEQQKGRRNQIQKSIAQTQQELRDNKRSLRRHEQARELIREAGLKTQQSLQYHISDITSLALDAVFEDPYELIAEFLQRRNKTECDLFFVRNENRMDPIEASGGGTIDVAAFALRIASRSMENPKSRNTIILDEPFKHLRGEEENKRVLSMIKEISQKLQLQIVMIGDVKVPREIILEAADKVFETNIKKGITKIESYE